MEFLPEMIIAGIIVVSLIIYAFPGKAYRKRRLKLLAKFRNARALSLRYQDALSDYILKHDVQNEIFVNNSTYVEYLQQLRMYHSMHFSDRRYRALRQSPIISVNKNAKKLDELERRLTETKSKIAVLDNGVKTA